MLTATLTKKMIPKIFKIGKKADLVLLKKNKIKEIRLMVNVLVSYSDFDNLPSYFLIPETSRFYELAIKSNGIIVNISDDEGDGVIDFICDISDAAYKGS